MRRAPLLHLLLLAWLPASALAATGAIPVTGPDPGFVAAELAAYWHAGSLPGTSAILVRTHDGFGWAALANARPADEALRDELDRLMWQIRRELRFWPPVDLF